MSRKYESVPNTGTFERLVETTCDLCGAVAKNGDWTSSTYETQETEIKVEVRQKEGNSYPSDGWGTEYRMDICPKCFKDELIPWLNSKGCKAKEVDWDY